MKAAIYKTYTRAVRHTTGDRLTKVLWSAAQNPVIGDEFYATLTRLAAKQRGSVTIAEATAKRGGYISA